MNKNTKIAIGTGAVLLVLLVAYVIYTAPLAPHVTTTGDIVIDYEDEVSLETRGKNTNLYTALISAGIKDPFVDITNERAYVAYSLPEGYDADVMQRFAIGAAADAAYDSDQIIVTQYERDTPKEIWTVQMSDFKDFIEQTITGEELDSKIVKEQL